jgi:hypothetical protein
MSDELRVHIVNRGLEPIAAHAVRVELNDSSESFVMELDSTTNSRTIPVGDSIEVVFFPRFEAGYHYVTISAHYDGDERPRNNSLTLLRRLGQPQLLISEVMSFPVHACPEYVELFNAGGTLYRFTNHWFRDGAHQPIPLTSQSGVVPPGGFIVVTVDDSLLLGCFPGLDAHAVVEALGTWPSLNHSGSGAEADSVIVLDRFLLPVDRVAYPPQPTDSRGRSLERVDLYPGIRPHVWVLSSHDGGGSPGSAHPRGILEVPKGRSVSVDPNPFDPTGGEALFVTVPVQSEPTRALVQLFDVSGKRLCELGSSTTLPFVFVWDGRDDAGRTVASGIYIVACELYGLTTGTRVVERVVLGCGARNR